ncbi:MAG: cbb3-type cytochrome oxidase assembly protein CcoS [Rhodobacteraceae bacterium]|nr:cbb3-type cytochrome oxidase assembly protein CcoS [Paracoccaceae bacterium]
MESIVPLIGVTLLVGLVWLAVMAWAIRTRQYSDPKGDAERILRTDYDDTPQ